MAGSRQKTLANQRGILPSEIGLLYTDITTQACFLCDCWGSFLHVVAKAFLHVHRLLKKRHLYIIYYTDSIHRFIQECPMTVQGPPNSGLSQRPTADRLGVLGGRSRVNNLKGLLGPTAEFVQTCCIPLFLSKFWDIHMCWHVVLCFHSECGATAGTASSFQVGWSHFITLIT